MKAVNFGTAAEASSIRASSCLGQHGAVCAPGRVGQGGAQHEQTILDSAQLVAHSGVFTGCQGQTQGCVQAVHLAVSGYAGVVLGDLFAAAQARLSALLEQRLYAVPIHVGHQQLD